LLSLICLWHCSYTGTETGAACLTCHLKLETYSGIGGGPCQAPFAALLRIRERLQIAETQNGLAWKLLLSLICSCHCSHRGTETGAACLSCHLKLQTYPGIVGFPCQAPFAAVVGIRERLQIAGSQKGLAWKAAAQSHLLMALLTQRHRNRGCLLVLPPQTSNVSWYCRGSLPGSFRSPAPNTRTSADSWQPEGASMESCCSASSTHGTARTEAQR